MPTDSPFPVPQDPRVPGKTPLASLASSSPPREKSRSKPRRRLPDDFAVTDDMITWAREHTPLVGAAETATFIDHWRGNGITKADWTATWRNWMRKAQNDAERYGSRASPRAAPKPSTTDERVNQGLALAEQLRREANGQLEISP